MGQTPSADDSSEGARSAVPTGATKIRLTDKVVVVTGFGSGLGRELAVHLAREGALVAGFSRRVDQGEETERLVRAENGSAFFLPVDVRDNEQIEEGVSKLVERFGGLDGVVNCAGARVTGTAPDTSPEQWDLAIATNLTGTFLVSRAAVPELRKRGGGAIVNIATTSALRAAPARVAHGVSKAGVLMLTTSMALDHASDRVRVNCVCPGPTATPLTLSDSRDLDRAAAGIPMGRVGAPEDVGEAVTYLLSDAGRHVTGVVLPVDGGSHLAVGP